MPLPKLHEEQVLTCEGEITESELLESLKLMESHKFPGNDRLTKEFYETFWEEINTSFHNSVWKSCLTEELNTTQRQWVIKLIKKDGEKIIKNWRYNSLLNVDSK